MDWMLFWTAFGAIGGTFGALATAAAVIVALWQTKYANKKKLKIEFSDNVQIIPARGNTAKFETFVGVTVTNIGNRNVKLKDWRLIFPDGHGALIVQDVSIFGKTISPPWPMTLEPEDQTSQHWEKDLFYAYIVDEVPKLSAKLKKKPIKWIVTDSTGQKYLVKTKKTAQEYYEEAQAKS